MKNMAGRQVSMTVTAERAEVLDFTPDRDATLGLRGLLRTTA